MFNPMQTQAALQNPAQFPDQRLQQYAAGQPPQPTGQVPPGPGGPAGLELTSRNAQRQAAARASAMQNDPSQSPTIFQQKDAQMAQQAQMIQQKEMQLAQMMQQKEAQLAKKERALGIIGALMARNQPRMSGIAQLPMRPDMYTAMDGGIVFNAGGGVPRIDMSGRAGPLSLEDLMDLHLGELDIIKEASKTRQLSPEERKRLIEEEEARLAKQYEKYEAGMAGVDEKAVAAARGRPYSFWSGIAAGLPTDTKNLRVAEAIASLARGVASERARAQEGESRAAALLAEAERRRMERQFQEERGRTDLAKKAADQEQALRDAAYRQSMAESETKTKILSGVGRQMLDVQTEKRREEEAQRKEAFEQRKYEEAPKRAEAEIRLQAELQAKNRPQDFNRMLFEIAANPKHPNHELALSLLGGQRRGADARPDFAKSQELIQARIDRFSKESKKQLEVELGRKPTDEDIREYVTKKYYQELELIFGPSSMKGQGMVGVKPNAPVGDTSGLPWERKYK